MKKHTPLMQMIILASLGYLVLAAVRVVLSLQAQKLQATPLMVGSLLAIFSLLPMFFALPAGRWLDRVGMARPLLIGATAIGTGILLLICLNEIYVMYLAAMLMGVGYMLIHIAAQNAIGNLSTPPNRTLHFSWLTLGFSVAGLLGPLLAGLAIDHGSFHLAYQILGCLSVGVVLLAVVVKLAVPPQTEDFSAGADCAPENKALDLLWHNKNLREIYWLGILLAAARDLFLFVVPVLGHQRDFSATSIGMVLAAFSLDSFLVRLCVPQLVTRFCEWRMLLVAFVISAVSFVVLPFISQALLMMLLALMLGLGQGVSQPNMLALLHRATPRGRGAEAIGIRVTIGNACQLSLPLAFGAALGGVGMLPIFLGMSAMVATGMPAIWRKLQAGQGFESAALAA